MIQNLARDEDGNVWEVDAQGNAIRIAQPATPSRGRVMRLPRDPAEVQQETRQAQNDAAAQRDRDADNARADAQADVQRQTAEQLIELRRLQIEAEREKTQTGNARRTTLNALVRQINRVQSLYEQNIEGFNWNAPFLGTAVPTEANQQFDTAGTQLSSLGLAAFRVPGSGTVSDRDALMFDRANMPSAARYDTSIEEQLRGMRSRVEEEFSSLGQPSPWAADAAAGRPEQRADNEVPGQSNGARTNPNVWDVDPDRPAERSAAGTSFGEIFTGATRPVHDAEMTARIEDMVNRGSSLAEVTRVMNERGAPPPTPAEWREIQKFRLANPGQRWTGADISYNEPMNVLERVAGSVPGTFLAQMGNTATAGIPAALAGSKGQVALDAMAELNPTSALVGSTIGGITGMAGAEAGLAARAPEALVKYAPRLADLLYGTTLGFNTAREGEGGTGALVGGGSALLGGYIGQKAMSGLGRLTRGVSDPSVRALREAGVPMTVGQAVGNSGRVGAAVKDIEDALTSVPGVGNIVDARRIDGLRGFNEAAFRRAAPPGAQITGTGAEGMGQVRQSVSDAYDNALSPAQIDANEATFIADLAAANAAASRIPNVNGAQDAATAALQSRIGGAVDPVTDTISGRNFQEAYRGLSRTGRERAGGDYGHEIGQVTRQGQDALGEALERQNPGAFEGFLEANAANRRAHVLADAVTRGANQTDGLFTPAQLNRADVASTSRLEGRINSVSGNRPFNDLANAGQSVLPSTLPDSGTMTRVLVGGGATGLLGGGGATVGGSEGAAAGTIGGLGTMLLLAAGGSRPAQRALTSMLLDRPSAARSFGTLLLNNARLGGTVGSGTAAAAYTGN